jgi:Glucosyl transferase GtrII
MVTDSQTLPQAAAAKLSTVLPSTLPSEQAGSTPFWRLNPTEYRVALTALMLALIARWQALLPGYSTDDFPIMVDEHDWTFGQFAAMGRTIYYELHSALLSLGAAPPYSPTLGVVLGTLALVAIGILACRLWKIQNLYVESTIAVCFIVLHPYQSETFTYRISPLFLAIPLVLCFVALVECHRSTARWLWSVGAMIVAFSIYQVAVNYAIMALLFGVVFYFCRAGNAESEPGFWNTLRSQLMMLVAAAAGYLVLTFTIGAISGYPVGSRGDFIGPADVLPRIGQTLTQLKKMFFLDEPILPIATKYILIAAMIAGLAGAFQSVSSRIGGPGVSRFAGALGLGLLLGIPLSIGMQLVLHEWWPQPRIIAQTGMLWGGIFALAYQFSPRVGRRVLLAAVSVILISFLGINDRIFADQHRLNMRDLAKANRIMARIESLPDHAQIRNVVVLGGSWRYDQPIHTAQGDMNISAFAPEWSRLAILNEISGNDFHEPAPDIKAKAVAYCRTAQKWPEAASVISIGAAAVVCLPEN